MHLIECVLSFNAINTKTFRRHERDSQIFKLRLKDNKMNYEIERNNAFNDSNIIVSYFTDVMCCFDFSTVYMYRTMKSVPSFLPCFL